LVGVENIELFVKMPLGSVLERTLAGIFIFDRLLLDPGRGISLKIGQQPFDLSSLGQEMHDSFTWFHGKGLI
jgi:hypothetical protein